MAAIRYSKVPAWSAALPLGALMESLEEVFASRFVLTRQGWRPLEDRPGASGKARPGLPLGRSAWRALAWEVMALHEAYTEREGEFERERNPIHHRIGGYQFYFLPRNLFRVAHVLDGLPWRAVNPEMRARDWLGATHPFRVLDLGCGSGALSLAVLAWIAASKVPAGQVPEVEFVLVDQARALIEIAQANLETFARATLPGLRLRVRAYAEGVSRYLDRPPEAGGGFSLVGAAMTLNELGLVGSDRRGRAPRTVDRIIAAAQEEGVVLLVEPGTRQGYLNLMTVRDQASALPILYPCPHSLECPMAGPGARRWCHATVSLPAGFFFDDALRHDGKLTMRMRELNLAALAFQKTPGNLPTGPFLVRSGSRVVSNPMPGRGANAEGQVLLLCGPEGHLDERLQSIVGPLSRGDWAPFRRN